MAQLKRAAGFPVTTFSKNVIMYVAALTGGGAAAALTVAGTSVLPASDQFAASCEYTATGLYVVTLKEMPGTILTIIPTLRRVAGTTLECTLRTWDAAEKTVTIDVRDKASSDAVADATTDDFIRLLIIAKS